MEKNGLDWFAGPRERNHWYGGAACWTSVSYAALGACLRWTKGAHRGVHSGEQQRQSGHGPIGWCEGWRLAHGPGILTKAKYRASSSWMLEGLCSEERCNSEIISCLYLKKEWRNYAPATATNLRNPSTQGDVVFGNASLYTRDAFSPSFSRIYTKQKDQKHHETGWKSFCPALIFWASREEFQQYFGIKSGNPTPLSLLKKVHVLMDGLNS